MTILTPTPDGATQEKQIVRGGGVSFRFPGSRFLVTGEVLAINEEAQTVRVRVEDKTGEVIREDIVDVLSGGDFATFSAIASMDVSDL